MATNISNTPHYVILSPNAAPTTSPSTFAIGGGAADAKTAVSDGNQSTYVQTSAVSNDHWFWFPVDNTLSLPTGSKVVYARAAATAYADNKSVREYSVALSDTDARGNVEQCGPRTSHSLPVGSTNADTFYGVARRFKADGKTEIDATAVRGLGVVFGENMTGKSEANTIHHRTVEAWVEVFYDTPPTATFITSGTISDTTAPYITWDYFDDLQPQAAYQLKITRVDTGAQVYDSGKVASSKTNHQVTKNLGQHSFTMTLTVWQKWNGSGVFPSVSPATGSFTISLAPLPTPGLTLGFSTGLNRVRLNWTSGAIPASDSPVMTIEYQDVDLATGQFGTDWTTFATVSMVSGGTFQSSGYVDDYTIRSNVTRHYRAWSSTNVNNTFRASDYATNGFSDTSEPGLWIHATSDPANTSTNFLYNGGGTTESIQVTSTSVPVQGRNAPFMEYSTQTQNSIACAVSLENESDKAKLENLARYQGNVTVRDGRGRIYTGSMGAVSFTNAGMGYDASFTITEADDATVGVNLN